jgi:hypothetical protein
LTTKLGNPHYPPGMSAGVVFRNIHIHDMSEELILELVQR